MKPIRENARDLHVFFLFFLKIWKQKAHSKKKKKRKIRRKGLTTRPPPSHHHHHHLYTCLCGFQRDAESERRCGPRKRDDVSTTNRKPEFSKTAKPSVLQEWFLGARDAPRKTGRECIPEWTDTWTGWPTTRWTLVRARTSTQLRLRRPRIARTTN